MIASRLLSCLISTSHSQSNRVALLSSAWDSIASVNALERSQAVASCSSLRESLRGFSAVPVYKARSPAGIAIAAGLVAPDSRILIHYKKNIDRPQLTTRIMKRMDVVELRDMVRLYESRMDPIHVVATLTRLQHLIHRRPPPPSSTTAADDDGPRSSSESLDSVAPSRRGSPASPAASSPETDASTEASERDRHSMGSEIAGLLVPVIRAISATHRETGAKFRHQLKPDSAATLLWSLAKLPPSVRSQVPGEVLDAILQRAVRCTRSLHDSPPRRMALLLWSISKLTPPKEGAASPQPTGVSGLSPKAIDISVDAVLSMTLAPTRLKPYLETCSPPVLALFLCSLESLGRLSKPIAEAISREVLMRLPNLAFKPFTAADYVGITQGFSRALRSVPKETEDVAVPLMATVAAHLVQGGAEGVIAAAAATSSLSSSVGYQSQLPGGNQSWKPEHLSNLASAFASAGIKHDGLFLGTLAACARPRLSQFHDWALRDLRDAYKALGYNEAWLSGGQ